MVDRYYVIERMFDCGGATKDMIRYVSLTHSWDEDIRNALTFDRSDAIALVKKYRKSFRDYNAQYSIDLADTVNLNQAGTSLEQLGISLAPTNNISFVDYDYIASFIVDLRYAPDYGIVHRSYLSVTGGFDSDSYFSECVQNAELGDFLETEITGRLKESEIVSGVFKLVYAVKCNGSESNGPDGIEYDSWETYTLLAKTELTKEEVNHITEEEIEQFSFEHVRLDTITISTEEYEKMCDEIQEFHAGGIHKTGDGM